jgi:hypothetical protein
MTAPILACTGCGATKPSPTGDPTDVCPSAHCGECPPWRCEDCGQMSSAADLCPCWTRLDHMTTADIKALFAADGTFNLGGLGPTQAGE